MRNMADKKYLWMVQIFWAGDWRNIFGSDKRYELAEYMESCPPELEMRIIDTTSVEEKKHGGRNRQR